jgi:hypothetical protein
MNYSGFQASCHNMIEVDLGEADCKESREMDGSSRDRAQFWALALAVLDLPSAVLLLIISLYCIS